MLALNINYVDGDDIVSSKLLGIFESEDLIPEDYRRIEYDKSDYKNCRKDFRIGHKDKGK